jgi:hypothetical protein
VDAILSFEAGTYLCRAISSVPTMIPSLRNGAIALGASMAALFVGAGLQELFVRLIPVSRTLIIGSVDMGTWAGFITIFVSFAIAGVVESRWLRSNMTLFWSMLGPVVWLVAPLLYGINVSECLSRWTTLEHMARVTCGMLTAAYVLPLLGALSGLLVFRLWRHFKGRGKIAV